MRRSTNAPPVTEPPSETCEACIILPVRDESVRIEKCLSAIAHQVDFRRVPINPSRFEVIVLAINCRDNTAALARAFGYRHSRLVLHVLEIDFAPEKSFVGFARKLLMDEACRRLLLLGRDKGIIASTDGDTCVEPTWLASILREVDAGADAVGGRVVADPGERSLLHPTTELVYLRQVAYGFLLAELEHRVDPDPFDQFPRHPNHNGASLAVTAATYARIGGLPDVAEEEDSALYKAILRSGARFRHSMNVRVTTSARLNGRVEHGFSAGLRQFEKLDRDSPSLLVENVSASEIRLRARRILRDLRQELPLRRPAATQVESIARLLGTSASWLWQEIQRPQPWGRLEEQIELRQAIEGKWERSWPKMLLERAIAALRLRLYDLRNSARKDYSGGSIVPSASKRNEVRAMREVERGRRCDTSVVSSGALEQAGQVLSRENNRELHHRLMDSPPQKESNEPAKDALPVEEI
jgi:Glycosyl transferase family 2